MMIPIRIVRGRWKRDDQGCYEHETVPGDMGNVISLRETDNFRKVIDLVKDSFNIRGEDDVELTYKWPAWMMGPEGGRSVPIDILDDEDMSLFMAIRADLEDVYLRVRVIPVTVGRNIHSFRGTVVTCSELAAVTDVSEGNMQMVCDLLAGVTTDNQSTAKLCLPMLPSNSGGGLIMGVGGNDDNTNDVSGKPRTRTTISCVDPTTQACDVYSGNEVSEKICMLSTNKSVNEINTTPYGDRFYVDRGKQHMFPERNITHTPYSHGDQVDRLNIIEAMLSLDGNGREKHTQTEGGKLTSAGLNMNSLVPTPKDKGNTCGSERMYISNPHGQEMNKKICTPAVVSTGSTSNDWVTSSGCNNKRTQLRHATLNSVRVNLFPDGQHQTVTAPAAVVDAGVSDQHGSTNQIEVGNPIQSNDDNDGGSAYEMWRANDASELWRAFCATKFPPVPIPQAIINERGKNPEFDLCVANMVENFNKMSEIHGDASLKLTLGVPDSELPLGTNQQLSQCEIHTVSSSNDTFKISSDESSGFPLEQEDLSSNENQDSGEDMDIDSGSSSDQTPLGYSTTMPSKYSQPLQLGGAIEAVEIGGPSSRKKSHITQTVMLKDTPVPTVLRDRDAPPYFDDPEAEDDLGRALRDVDYEGDDIFIGRIFKTREDCRMKLAIHAIHRKFHFRCAKSEPQMLIAVCVSDSCPWRVYATKMDDSDRFVIRSATQQHTCSVDARGNFHKQASTAVIGDLMKTRYIGVGRGPRPSELRRMLRHEFSLNVSYWKAWRAKEIAMDNALGSAMGSFALIQPYFRLLMETNPNFLVSLETEVDAEGHERFKYLFMSLSASIQGFAYMRKVVVIDGTHLRGKYGGCLVAASAQDANFQIFPLAFGIVNSENDDAWTWFMRKLSEIVQDDPELVFVSDRHSSIYASIRRVYPMASHAACVVHLKRNIDDIFKTRELSELVNDAARAFRLQDFTRLFGRIREMNGDCADYLTGIGFEHWTRSHFLGHRYNVMTSNIAESLNNVLTMARDYPVISILETLRTTLVTWFALRREAAMLDDNTLPPKVHDMVIENFETGASFKVLKIGDGQYEVRDTEDSAFAVHLWERTCTCREFQLLTIPCSHAVAAAIKEGILVETMVGVHHTVAMLRLSYAGLIMPVPDMATLTPLADDVGGGRLAPPHVRRPPGRPRKRRIFSRGEFKRTARRRCGRCRVLGHNRSTCKKQISGP